MSLVGVHTEYGKHSTKERQHKHNTTIAEFTYILP
jgi:hypothetical protein